jgi:sugar phosphate isomerase/epimerase
MNKTCSDESTSCSRRNFLAAATTAAAAVGASRLSFGSAAQAQESAPGRGFDISVFSKCLQWLDYPGLAAVAAETRFDGVDLTVRAGGHVVPERVEEDLPKAVEAATKAGVHIRMIVTDITDPRDARTARVLRTAGQLGVRHYRLGWYRYHDSGPIMAQLDEIKPRLRDLADLSKQYGVAATYQNHSGAGYVGAPLWDLHYLLRDLDPRWLGVQFDIHHAVVEGGLTWPINLRLLAGFINTLVVKDFRWTRHDAGWVTEDCPLGQGIVDLPAYVQMLRRCAVSAPISLHFEYALGGAENGARQLTVPRKTVEDALRSDLSHLRKVLGSSRV